MCCALPAPPPGLRQSPAAIAKAARDEAVDVVGLSILSGAHLPLCTKIAGELRRMDVLDDVLWVVGGNIPAGDHAALKALGVAEVFRTGARFEAMVAFIRDNVGPR